MNKKVQEGFRKDLLDRRNILLKSVAGAEADLLTIAEERESELAEQAQEERLAQLLARLDERGRSEIDEIDAAITRIDDGDFGLCEDCDGDIAVQRLRALPFARLCVECASERETSLSSGSETGSTGDYRRSVDEGLNSIPPARPTPEEE